MRVMLPTEPGPGRLVAAGHVPDHFWRSFEDGLWYRLSDGWQTTWYEILGSYHDGVDVLDHYGNVVIAEHPHCSGTLLFRLITGLNGEPFYAGVSDDGSLYTARPDELEEPVPYGLVSYDTMLHRQATAGVVMDM